MVSILSTKTAKSPHLMHLLRCFSFYCAFYCVNVSCVHVPGAMNAASYNKLPVFSSLVPQVLPFPIPASLVELLVTSRPDWGSQAWTELFVRSLTGGSLSLHRDPMQQGRNATSYFCSQFNCRPLPVTEATLFAIHCTFIINGVSHTKQIVDTCVLYTTFKLFITYLTLLGILPLAELCSSGSLSRCLWKKSFTDLLIFT